MTVAGAGFSVAAAESRWCGMVLLLLLRLPGGKLGSKLRTGGSDGGGIDRSVSDRCGGGGGPIVSGLRSISESRPLRSERSDTDDCGFGIANAAESLPFRFFSVERNLCGSLTNPSQASEPQTQTLMAFMK